MKNTDIDFKLDDLTLGKTTEYQSSYSPDLLQPVPRSINRNEIKIRGQLPFFGEDIWHGYEVSWLNQKGKPIVVLLKCYVPCESPNLIESKSFKLYLNSFNQSRFESQEEVKAVLFKDLSAVAGCAVKVELFSSEDTETFTATKLPGYCIDVLDIEVDAYNVDPSLLKLDNLRGDDGSSGGHSSVGDDEEVNETLHSHLLKSNCLITNQPDWASVVISYSGRQICHESLLRYLISFRMHNEFHEQCVERIYTDLMTYCDCRKLSVQALYTRRGGLDINPFRSSEEGASSAKLRINRQ